VEDYAGVNLKRLMAAGGLSIREVAQRAGLDERTVRAVCNGRHRPRGKTLHRLAAGLGAPVDQFFIDPAQLAYRHFDRATNPMVEDVLEDCPEMFHHWTEADFDELNSQMGIGGALTREGTIEAVGHINRKRRLHEKLDLLLETTHGEMVGEMIELLYERMAHRVG
jgi:transcriptional regulator with XRE-family HTH domain